MSRQETYSSGDDRIRRIGERPPRPGDVWISRDFHGGKTSGQTSCGNITAAASMLLNKQKTTSTFNRASAGTR